MKKINESFTCIGCWKQIPLANKTCRNHCPYCFVSRHVDGDIPWDRDTQCHGNMYPVQYEQKNWTIKIQFKCSKCGKLHWNKRSDDDQVEKLNDLIREYRQFTE